MEYSALSIFHDITNAEVDAMIQCFRMRRGEFAPGQTICVYGESGGEVGVLLRGEAELVRFDYAGTRTILERLETGGVFGEALAFTPTLGDCVEVVSDRNSEVLFMEYEHIMKRCERACTHHSKLVRNMFRLVADQTRRLSRLVRRMLDLSRLNALTQSTVTAQETFDLTEVMSQVLISLETKITDRQLDVEVKMPEGKLMVWGDPDAITQVCYNLLDNAAKFAAPGTAITAQITKKDGKAHVTIRNLGATIPPDELPLLFERFHKADYSRSMDREGVGLGLYIVKTILGNLKENITVASEDGVTQFQFTLTLA